MTPAQEVRNLGRQEGKPEGIQEGRQVALQIPSAAEGDLRIGPEKDCLF